eukprot:TRINITY_DN292_c0_g1_i1.p2 TRINITY_DN292_c0_g1~~TRINITY_DN292_c0_g1_i1.p2  ORF type:complete len:132 (-),score=44.50 TRINITY_DN292_c0_g1_i1:67-462(-)
MFNLSSSTSITYAATSFDTVICVFEPGVILLSFLLLFFFLMIRRPPRSTQSRSSAASDVYKRQVRIGKARPPASIQCSTPCLLYTSDAADDLLCVDLGGRRIIKKKNNSKKDNRITPGSKTHITVSKLVAA